MSAQKKMQFENVAPVHTFTCLVYSLRSLFFFGLFTPMYRKNTPCLVYKIKRKENRSQKGGNEKRRTNPVLPSLPGMQLTKRLLERGSTSGSNLRRRDDIYIYICGLSRKSSLPSTSTRPLVIPNNKNLPHVITVSSRDVTTTASGFIFLSSGLDKGQIKI